MANNSTNSYLYSTEHFITYSFVIVVSLFGIFGNSLVWGSFLKFPQLRKKECSPLLAVLAISDTIICIGNGFILAPGQLYYHFSRANYNSFKCIFIAYFYVIGAYSGQIVTFAIAYDRYQVFKDPLKYEHQQLGRYSRRILLFSVVFGFAATSLAFVGVDLDSVPDACTIGSSNPKYPIIYASFLLCICPAILALYSWTLLKMCKTKIVPAQQNKNNRNSLAFQVKVTKTITWVIVLYTIFWVIPNITYIAANLLKMSPSMLGRLMLGLVMGAAINSSCNPAIYIVRKTLLSRYMWAFLKCKHSNAQLNSSHKK